MERVQKKGLETLRDDRARWSYPQEKGSIKDNSRDMKVRRENKSLVDMLGRPPRKI